MKNIVVWAFTAAMAGLLFGFDTAVISGADQAIQQQWGLSNFEHGLLVMSMALWGTVVGAMFGYLPVDRFGRKGALVFIGWAFFISAVGSAVVNDPYSFAVLRFIGGLAVGASSIAAPAYISEISPRNRRGMLVTIFQLNIGFGILLAFVSNFLVRHLVVDDTAWRWMLAVEAVPAIFFLFCLRYVPESPRWLLVSKGDVVSAKRILSLINQNDNSDDEVNDILSAQQEIKHGSRGIPVMRYRWPLILAVLLALFNQLSGVNFVVFYAPRILESAGFAENAALLSSVSVGAAMFIFTAVGMLLIDRIGRRSLLMIGSVGYIVSLSLIAKAFFSGEMGDPMMALYLFLFISAHGIGQGSIIWVFIAEIFPDRYRAQGQSVGTATHWICAAIITLIMPWALQSFGGGPVFVFFAGMMVIQLLFSIFVMPETKGVSLEELQKRLVHSRKDLRMKVNA